MWVEARAVAAAACALVMVTGCAFIDRASFRQDGSVATGNPGGTGVAISANGRYLAFTSTDGSIVPADTNASWDVFVRDVELGTRTTERASDPATGDGGGSDPQISDDGRYVLFEAFANDWPQFDLPGNGGLVLRRDRESGATEVANRRTDGSYFEYSKSFGPPAMSGDGRYVVFSTPTPLAGETDQDGDLFVRDMTAGTTSQITPNEANGSSRVPRISADGSTVAFVSDASTLVGGDTNGLRDVFTVPRTGGTFERVSVATGGTQSNGTTAAVGGEVTINADGRYVAFESGATNLVTGDTNGAVDLFVRDRSGGTTTRVNLTDADEQAGEARQPAISGDGRFVAFSSDYPVVPWCGGVAVRDRVAGTTACASTNWTLAPTDFDGALTMPRNAISRDGRYVAFRSAAGSLVDDDPTDGSPDVFFRAIPVPTITGVSPASVPRGETTTVVLTGTAFFPGVGIGSFPTLPLDGITVSAVHRVSDTQLEFDVTVSPTAVLGARIPLVFNVGTGPSPLAGTAGAFAFDVN